MGILIAAILFGIGFTFLATQNTGLTTLRAGTYIFTLPLFAVVLGALLLGLFVAWFLSAIGWVSHSITLHRKNGRIKDTEHTIDRLETRIQELEFENNRLREERKTAEDRAPIRGLFKRLDPRASTA